MGLDMYIRSYDKDLSTLSNEDLEKYWDDFKEEAYWRKSNQIHKWFVDNIQNGVDECQYSRPITLDEFKTLRDLCKKTIYTKNSDLLAPQSGFFFGSVDIDEYYWEDIKNTIKKLNSIIENWDNNKFYSYHSSW